MCYATHVVHTSNLTPHGAYFLRKIHRDTLTDKKKADGNYILFTNVWGTPSTKNCWHKNLQEAGSSEEWTFMLSTYSVYILPLAELTPNKDHPPLCKPTLFLSLTRLILLFHLVKQGVRGNWRKLKSAFILNMLSQNTFDCSYLFEMWRHRLSPSAHRGQRERSSPG